MDNLCHTLVGAAFGEAGLKSQTRFGSATLMIAANLPDLDVLVFATDLPSVAFRRGWTHGVLAQALLPVALTAAMMGIDRAFPAREGVPAVRARGLLLLSYVGVLSHVALDLLNNYGVRLLMPFSDRWFYGDALFIVDPWVWISLLAGVILARRRAMRGARAPEAPARIALAGFVLYALLMAAAGRVGRVAVERSARAAGREPALRTMAAPAPLTPAWRTVVRDLGGRYEVGELRWGFPPRYEPEQILDKAPAWPCGGADPGALQGAVSTLPATRFLRWSRFPRLECDLRA